MGMVERAEKRGDSAQALVRILLDFEPAAQEPGTIVRTWKCLAHAAGFSVKTVRRTLEVFGVDLPHWGAQGGSANVFLPKSKLVVLRQLIFRRRG